LRIKRLAMIVSSNIELKDLEEPLFFGVRQDNKEKIIFEVKVCKTHCSFGVDTDLFLQEKGCIMAIMREPKTLKLAKCLMCEGALEKSNMGNICNVCKDKFRK